MSEAITSSDARARPLRGIAAACALIAAAVFPTALIITAILSPGFSIERIRIAVGVGAICCLAACGAFVATYFGSLFHLPIHGVLLGMMFRMGLPLLVVMALPGLQASLPVREIGVTIVGTYLVALAIETVLVVRMIASTGIMSAMPTKEVRT